MTEEFCFNWSDLAFSSKKTLRSLRATWILAPREMSPERLRSLMEEFLPKGNLVIGVAEETYVLGLESQPQFIMLEKSAVEPLVRQIHSARLKHSAYIFTYSQRDVAHILEKKLFRSLVLVRGSWKGSLHLTTLGSSLLKNKLSYEQVSPFIDETEAKAYVTTHEKDIIRSIKLPKIGTSHSKEEMIRLTDLVAKQSYDYGFQTGAVLAKKRVDEQYTLLAFGFNKVVPYQTYALHFGASRELHVSPPNDQNHYDTVHAEMHVLVSCLRSNTDVKDTTLFVNLMPCPACGRALAETDISAYVYTHDHSEGYSLKLLQQAGKNVTRLVV